MERRAFQCLAFLLLSCAAVAVIALQPRRYPIDTLYAFPVRPDTPEWEELDAAGLARQAVKLPEGLAFRMTSKALLETALKPAAGCCFRPFPRVWKRWLTERKAENHGLHHRFTKIMQTFPR